MSKAPNWQARTVAIRAGCQW